MATERRRTAADPAPVTRSPPINLQRFRAELVIDKDDLDECLIKQPELYYHVAEAHSQAVADRDATKLDVEIAEAEEGQKIRDHAAQMEEKLTEAGLREQLILSPRLQKLRRLRIEQETIINGWMALKESFHQRSYMLRELVPLHMSRLSGGSVRVPPRQAMADDIRDRAGQERSRRRGEQS